MTPGNFRGIPFDGVMRDIVGNHVALVKDGRAGPDVVVGDSSEGLMSTKAIMARATSIAALNFYLKPRIATDAKPDYAKIFDGVSGAKFKAMRPTIAQRITEQLKPKLARDANLEDVEKVLGMLEKHEVDGGDATVTPEQNTELANSASAIDLPAMKPANDEHGGLRGFLKEKGMGEDDINSACETLKNKAADADPDEDEEAKKKREKDEADKKANDEAEAKKKDEDEKKAKDAAMKDMVTKPAMDAAIKVATDTATKKARETERGIRTALSDIRPFVGELASDMAFDSGADVYRHALTMRGVEGAKTMHESALKTVLELLPKAGAQPSGSDPLVAMDAATIKSADDRFGLNRIKSV